MSGLAELSLSLSPALFASLHPLNANPTSQTTAATPFFPLCALNQHKFGFIVFVCLFALISFPFQRLPIRDLQTSEAEWQGSCGFTFVLGGVRVCVHFVCVRDCEFAGFAGIGIKLKHK